ncbi:MAG: 2Fe-2S iron-sulfur cluster binding domain-containing protein [Sphingomonadales bacterium]|nr:2Fe-2S iron-sulfur cluster binding domain-containing protein [Sphingomonadales bacterium]
MSAQVTVLPTGQTFEVMGDETLLEAGLRAGLSLPYGCSNGTCGQCKCRVTQGPWSRSAPTTTCCRLRRSAKAIPWPAPIRRWVTSRSSSALGRC